MWDFSFAIPSLLILGLILLFYFSLPRLHINMNRMFLCILILESMIIITDILSSLADEHLDYIPLSAAHILNTLYFALFFLRAGALFMYTRSVLRIWFFTNGRLYLYHTYKPRYRTHI